MPQLLTYQKRFVDFLVRSNVLTFGEFTLKSGRKAPYFLNFGNFDDGVSISQIGKFYAEHIVANNLSSASVVFGPAYKGVPLCVTTSIALAESHGVNVGFSFDRKEAKDHGERGLLVGHKIADGDRILIVEDVVTAGTTFHKIAPFLRSLADIEITGAVVAVDRCERGNKTVSAVQEIESSLGMRVFPIITVHHIVQYLKGENASGFRLSLDLIAKIEGYLTQYGVSNG